jgi:glycosyltransferase involved in cell wall biosynthesis
MTEQELEGTEVEETVARPAPLLSVIIPVYNGARKIEKTVRNIQAKIDEIESTMWAVETERSKIEHSLLTTGQLPEDLAAASTPEVQNQQRMLMYAGGEVASTTDVKVEQDMVDEGSAGSEAQQSPSGTLKHWYEIIIVNDGSTDRTRHAVDELCNQDERIKMISYSVNMGKGYAIKQGVLHSAGRYVLFMDGDGDISADILTRYLERLSKTHIVIGSKSHFRSVVNAPASRKFFSRCFQLYARTLLGLKIRDTQVGLKAGRGEVFRKIFGRVQVHRYAFDAEMLAIAGVMDLKIAELPVKIDLDRQFKLKEMARMAIDVLGVAFRLRVIKWYQKNMEKRKPQFRLPPIFKVC